MIIGWTSTKAMFFQPIENSRWPPSADRVLTQDPMGKCLKNFSSETSKSIQSKHCMDVHWMDLYKFIFFVPIGNSRQLPSADIVLTQDPMGKCLKNFSSETSKPIQSKHCIDFYKSYVFCAGNSRWLPPADIVLTQNPMGKC